jgi:hypothetical protein
MSGRSNGGDRARSVRLPEGSAAAYAAWVSFVSLSEEGLRKRPSLLRKASSAGFVTTKTAKIAHRVLLGPLAHQAGEALREAESPIAMVRPILTAKAQALEEAASYSEEWGTWFAETGIADEIGVPLPDPQISALRGSALKSIREQLKAGTKDG